MGRRLTLILGGARSGKSTYAQKLAAERGRKVLFVATASAAGDPEMKARIDAHRAKRPSDWRTLEVQARVGAAIQAEGGSYEVVLIDCLTLLADSVLGALSVGTTEDATTAALTAELDDLLSAFETSKSDWIVVSNEVGLGVVPAYPSGRLYRDALGRIHQRLAERADEVLFMMAGLPLRLKPGPR